jgi:hypothetical protein
MLCKNKCLQEKVTFSPTLSIKVLEVDVKFLHESVPYVVEKVPLPSFHTQDSLRLIDFPSLTVSAKRLQPTTPPS